MPKAVPWALQDVHIQPLGKVSNLCSNQVMRVRGRPKILWSARIHSPADAATCLHGMVRAW